MRRGNRRPAALAAGAGALLVFFAVTSPAQVTKPGDDRQERDLLQSLSPVRPAASTGFALDAPVDPDAYAVGPSDEFTLNLWTSPPVEFRMSVTPEGTLIVPTVAEVAVTGLSLSDARKKVIQAVKRKYLSVEVTVTLTQPRPVIVTVMGEVMEQGRYTLRSTDRVDRAIEEANKLADPGDQATLDRVKRDMSKRYIILQRHDGRRIRVDLDRFRALGENSANPYLQEGDIVVVPRKHPAKNMVGIYGEVNLPGRYEFVEGDRLIDLLRLAHGTTDNARLDSIELATVSEDGAELKLAYYSAEPAALTSLQDIALQPGDAVVVRPRGDLREDFRVHVQGEVLHPGTYPITKDRTRLSEVIAMAGGFMGSASLNTAELIRRSIHPDLVETERMMSLRSGMSRDDSVDYIRETELRLRKEIVNVDFERLFTAGDSTQDVIVWNEDVVRIPKKSVTIYVFGQILTPGHIPYLPGEDPEYYVRQAGGYTGNARADDIRIIKARTKQWLAPDEAVVEEGDYIWVPKDREVTFGETMATAGQAAAVLSVIVGMTAVVISLSD